MAGVVEGCATDLASEGLKRLFALAKSHASYCFHFRKHVENFEEKLKGLESIRKDALAHEQTAMGNNQELSNDAKNKLEKTNKLIKDAKELQEKLEEELANKLKEKTRKYPKCMRTYGLVKKAAKMILDLDSYTKTLTEIINSDNFSHPAPLPGIEYYAPTDFIALESRKEAYDKVWNALQDEQKLRVGVYGMGGLGKTTLVTDLGCKAKKEKVFEKVVLVVVSDPPNIGAIQENIASELGLEFKNKQESDRARELWLRLTQGEKILIILDDVWRKLDFKVIGIPFEDKHKGCRILLTTRKVDICTTLECQSKIQLSVLSEKDSWKLFQNYANISNSPSIPLRVAEKIACECKGLPIAIKIVASTLKDGNPQEWVNALITLENAEPLIGIDEHLIEIYNCLKFSYDNLKSREVQELFLLCSFFPEDYEIHVESLTRYAIGLHLFGDGRSFTKARVLALNAKKALVDSCLLLNVESWKGEYVKMHDLVHDVAHWIAYKENKEIKEITGSKIGEDSWDRARYLWYHMTTDLPNQLNYPSLENLMISIETESFRTFFEENEEIFNGIDNLRALTFTMKHASYKDLSFKLPQSIQVLKSLRILRLKGGRLGDISVIESLKSLEILELCNCEIDELPDGMLELKNLKLFEFSDCKILQNRQPELFVIGKLVQLEELYYSMPSESQSSETINRNNISDFLPLNCQWSKLRRYRIQIGSKDINDVDDLIATCLSIERFHPSESNETIKDLVRRAEYLCLYLMEGGCKNIVPDLVRAVGGEIRWINMYLRFCQDIECLIDSTNVSSQDASMLSALVELKVEEMDDLKELCHGTPPFEIFEKLRRLFLQQCSQLHGILFVGNINFSNLKIVLVDNCPVLTSLFTLSVALSLEMLEELIITECAGLEHVIADEREWEKEDFNQKISHGSFFGKLKIVIVTNCDSLKFIFPISLAGRLIQLEKISINSAAKLEHIFGLYQDEGGALRESDKEIMLPLLHDIVLKGVPSFDSIFPMYADPKDCLGVEATDLEATTPVILHSSQKHATTWYTSAVQCLPKKLANVCHIRCGSQAEVALLDTTTSKELHASHNTDTRLPPHLYAVQYCLSRHLNMCNVREMTLSGLSTKVVSLFTLSSAQTMLVKRLKIFDCGGLKHIVTNGEVDFDRKSCVSIFPELQYLWVGGCNLLEFILSAGSAQCPPKLEILKIRLVPELKSVFGQCYNDNHLSHQHENVTNIMEPDRITTEEILRHDNMLNITNLEFRGSGVEGIFMMEGVVMNEQQHQLTSRLADLRLFELAELRYICMGPPQCLSFQNLTYVAVRECGKLSCLFSVSVARSLPQLSSLAIENCNELEQIVEDDHIPNVCFPNLSNIFIDDCNKLKYLLFISKSNHFPKLEELDISHSSQLEEVFRWRRTDETQDRDITLLPKLKMLQLTELPCLTDVYQGFNLETVRERGGYVYCPQLYPEYKNEESSTEEVVSEQYTTSDEEGEALGHLHSPITVMEQQCMDDRSKESKQEETEHEEGKKGEESQLTLEVVQTTTSLPTIADLDSVESNTIDQKESTDAAPQTSSHFPSGTSSNAPKESNPSAAPQDSRSNPFVVPPSSNFPSCTSGDARKEPSTSATQYDVAPIEKGNGEEMIIDQFTASGKSRDATPQSSTDQAINISEKIHGSKSVNLDEEGVSASSGSSAAKFEDPPSKELSLDNVFSGVESEKTDSKNIDHLTVTTFLGTQGLYSLFDQNDVRAPLNVSPDQNESKTYVEDVLDAEHVADTSNAIAASGIVKNDHLMADVNPPGAPAPFLAVMPHDLASLVNNADDVELVSAFVAAHSDLIFPNATLSSIYRQSSYQTLIMLLKLLRSYSTLELVCKKKHVLIEHLDALKCYGFSGPWLESLLNQLQGPCSSLAFEELHHLIQTEVSYSSQRSSLMKHIDKLTASLSTSKAQLVDVEAKLKEISVKKKTYEDAFADLGSYFYF